MPLVDGLVWLWRKDLGGGVEGAEHAEILQTSKAVFSEGRDVFLGYPKKPAQPSVRNNIIIILGGVCLQPSSIRALGGEE